MEAKPVPELKIAVEGFSTGRSFPVAETNTFKLQRSSDRVGFLHRANPKTTEMRQLAEWRIPPHIQLTMAEEGGPADAR